MQNKKQGWKNKIKLLTECPKCGSKEIWKNGFEINTTGKHQRFKCKKCGYIWSE